MPSLFDLTNNAPLQQDAALPVAPQRVYVTLPDNSQPPAPVVQADPAVPASLSANGSVGTSPVAAETRPEPTALGKIYDKLTGSNGEERYQLWPEKVVREALAAPHDAVTGAMPQYAVDPATGDVHTSPQMIEGAQAVSALAGSGGLAGTTDATLGSTAFLRPALKYDGKIYKAPINGQHLDALPAHLAEDFQTKAMSGQDINDYNFGFMNHKGQFLDREKALDYAVKEGLVDPSAGQYGALTSTLLADSSKPGTAIEAMAKTQPKFDFTPGESSGSRSVKLGPTEITYGVNPKNNDVELSLIKTDKNQRGEGNGRAAIEQFLKEADTNDKRVLLNADPMDKSTSKAELESFYKSLGFVRNTGRNKDFTTRAEYIRNPLLKSDNEAGAGVQALKASQPFYSALEHNVNQISQSKMTGDQWLGTLSNKPGVKPEEMDWTGVKDFLKERGSQPVTKAELQEHLANNKVELKEVKKGAGLEAPEIAAKRDEFQKLNDKADEVEKKGGELTQPEYDRMHELSGELMEHPNPWLDKNNETKYHSYQLPGGSNYKEMLMTLPHKGDALNARRMEIEKLGRNATPEQRQEWANIMNKLKPDDRDIEGISKFKGFPDYKSSHWDEPNILAHVRMNDRIIDGKKSLHLEEIQSDFLQEHRNEQAKIVEAINKDFDGIADRMVKAGVIKKICD